MPNTSLAGSASWRTARPRPPRYIRLRALSQPAVDPPLRELGLAQFHSLSGKLMRRIMRIGNMLLSSMDG
eukprot:1635605-Pyramimonas_sp.AAC.1